MATEVASSERPRYEILPHARSLCADLRERDRNEQQLNALSGATPSQRVDRRQEQGVGDTLETALQIPVPANLSFDLYGRARRRNRLRPQEADDLFSDVVNFTETTDKLESEDLTNLLNRYLTEMTNIALQFGATVDKYIGDAIMVFFGDPESKGVKEDARACVRMAIAMLRRMRELQAEWQELGAEQSFHLRIGINTGYVTVGNFGSDDRMDYTIIGSSVNLTARLQSFAEIDGILIGHETHALVKDEIDTEEQTPITVKGFAEPIRCYKILGLYDDLVGEGAVIREEAEGFKFLLDLQKRDKATAIETLERILTRLRE